MEKGTGVLYIPSNNHSGLIEVNNVDFGEACTFVGSHDLKSLFGRKDIFDAETGELLDGSFLFTNEFTFYIDKVDCFSVGCPMLLASVLHEIKKLTKVKINGMQGKRSVFIDDSRIGIGCTVFGNTACYTNYVDSKIEDKLKAIQERIDNYTYEDTI